MRETAIEAGAIALSYFRIGENTAADIDYKEGGSPVSAADRHVDDFLRARLRALLPAAGWLSEETTDGPERLTRERVFIVDPIDGTRAFIKGDLRWGVSMALVEDGKPVIGVLHMPALKETFLAIRGSGVTLNGAPIGVSRQADLDGARIAGPAKALAALEARHPGMLREPRVPSLAYRLALVGAGRIDAAIASTNAWDWDIAAADLIVQEAGGRLTDLAGHTPGYNGPVPRHPILTAAPVQLHESLVVAVSNIVPA